MKRQLAICGLLMAIGVFLAPAASAEVQAPASDCDVKIVDSTSGHLVNIAAVQQAIARLEATGADVRVRAFQEAPDSLPSYQESQLQQCPTWRGPDGFIKPNMVTILFSMERQSYIFYGGNFHDELDDSIDNIRKNVMGTQFKAGNITGGVVDALDAIEGDITPTDWGNIVKWVAIIACSLVALVFFLLYLVGSHKARVKRRKTQTEAKSLRDKASAGYTAIDKSVTELGPDYVLAIDNIDGAGEKELVDGKASIDADLAALTNLYQEAISNPDNDPDKQRNQAGYDANVKTWQPIADLVDTLQANLTTTMALCRATKEKIEQTPHRLALLRHLVLDLDGNTARFVQKGYNPVGTEFSSGVDERFAEVQRLITAKQFNEAIALLDAIEADRQALSDLMISIPENRASMGGRLKKVRVTATSFDTSLAAAGEDLARAQRDYAPSCWTSSEQILELATQTAGSWQATASDADTALSMEVQNWGRAETLIVQLETAASNILSGCRQVARNIAEIDDIASTAAATCDTLGREISSAKTNLGGYKGKQSDTKADLDSLKDELPAIRQLLEADRPDYLKVKSQLDAVAESLKSVLKEAKKRHDKVLKDEADAAEAIRKANQEAEDRRRSAATHVVVIGGGGGGFGDGGGHGGGGGGGAGGSSGGDW